jgi:hypothetical protein
MTAQISLDLPSRRRLPLVDIIKMILDRGEPSKDQIRLLWDVSEEEHEVLKDRLSKEKLIDPGPTRYRHAAVGTNEWNVDHTGTTTVGE